MDRRKLLGLIPWAAPVLVAATLSDRKEARVHNGSCYKVEWQKAVRVPNCGYEWNGERDCDQVPYKLYKKSWVWPLLPVYLTLLEEIGAEVVEIDHSATESPYVIAAKLFPSFEEAEDYRHKIIEYEVREGGDCMWIRVSRVEQIESAEQLQAWISSNRP